jgi:3'-5' exonuclease
MLENIKLDDVLFLDIETVPQVYNYNDLNEQMKKLWDARCRNQERSPDQLYNDRAGIMAEFSKVVCISVGYFKEGGFRLKSFFGDDEKELLLQFAFLLDKYYNRETHLLCAHNGKEFDFPFIARRMLLNAIKLPAKLDIAGKKPWEVKHLDTMELWKFGDYKSFTSLNLLAAIFGIPTPKDDIDGSDVARVYWEEHDLPRIATYCQKDVLTVARVLQKFRNEALVPDEAVVITDETQPLRQPLKPRTLPGQSPVANTGDEHDKPQLSIFV